MKRYRVVVDGRIYEVEIDDPRARPVTARVAGVAYAVEVQARPDDAGQVHLAGDSGRATAPLAPSPEPDASSPETAGAPSHPVEARPAASEPGAAVPQTMTAPIPGVVASVVANVGQVVKRGDELLTLEAMKMFNVLRSPWAGTVTTLHVSKGEHVNQGQPLVTFGRR